MFDLTTVDLATVMLPGLVLTFFSALKKHSAACETSGAVAQLVRNSNSSKELFKYQSIQTVSVFFTAHQCTEAY